MNNRHTILIGGKAGEGVKKAAQVIASISHKFGRYTFQMDDYQSLIKGGHNFSVVTSDTAEVFATYSKADLIICFDQRSISEHEDELTDTGMIIYNSDAGSFDKGIALPLSTIMKKHLSANGNISVSIPAIFCALLNTGKDFLVEQIIHYYRKEREANVAYAVEVYDLVDSISPRIHLARGKRNLKSYSGNQLIALGAWTAGLDMYFSYPMTPASSILHFLASKQSELGVYAIHTESELAAINMAIGAAYSGAKTAVGSSGGGFALMQESFSLAGMAEAPLLNVLSSRPGPATGVSTYTAQEDLNFALGQGHGEFCRIVASPDSHERAFSLAAELLALAWELQIPTILLTEKHLSESMKTTLISTDELPFAEPKKPEESLEYDRYHISDDGVSPLAFPPSENVIKWNSHEHLESGLRTDKADAMVAMKDKRYLKYETARKAVKKYRQFEQYGDGDIIVFAYGSTVMELREAAKNLAVSLKIVAPVYLEPFPAEELQSFYGKEAIIVEHNQRASFATLLQTKLNIKVKATILKYDGRPFDPVALANKLVEAINA